MLKKILTVILVIFAIVVATSATTGMILVMLNVSPSDHAHQNLTLLHIGFGLLVPSGTIVLAVAIWGNIYYSKPNRDLRYLQSPEHREIEGRMRRNPWDY
jgi:ABC-type transport system involved in multi-copper enzyme maturation permease subunit